MYGVKAENRSGLDMWESALYLEEEIHFFYDASESGVEIKATKS